jgi:hypothetical protein
MLRRNPAKPEVADAAGFARLVPQALVRVSVVAIKRFVTRAKSVSYGDPVGAAGAGLTAW